MASTPYFALPFRGGYRSSTTAASSHHRKRKRDNNITSSENEDSHDTSSDESLSSSMQRASLLDAQSMNLEKAQLTVPKDFPHRGTRSDVRGNRSRASPDTSMQDDEVQPIRREFFQESKHSRGLRQQHISVLTTILHRCLLQNDFLRAGRAWGMLLRTECNGKSFDVRHDGRWGIGAEILLHREYQNSEPQRRTADEDDSDSDSSSSSKSGQGSTQRPSQVWFSKEGFEKAKDYYERLILHYPYRKFSPRSVSALDFYPAMFSLWIYAIQEEREASKAGVSPGDIAPGLVSGDQELQSDTLDQAVQLADRMDSIMISPPYSDNVSLMNLRNMVNQWIEDLRGQVERDGGFH